MEAGLTESDVPEPTEVPPQLPVNQSTVSPPPTDADKVEDAPLQMLPGDADGLLGVPGSELTVTVTLAQDDAVQGEVSQRAK